MQGKIYSGFPGVGKSTLVKNNPNILDSDSSAFDKTQFPQNYIEHIKQVIAEGKDILVSSHKTVRDALVENDLAFVLFYPSRVCKKEYLARYRERNSPEAFITLLEEKWDDWISECEEWPGHKIELHPGEYISDYVFCF